MFVIFLAATQDFLKQIYFSIVMFVIFLAATQDS
jgi:hypothetical protein